DLLPRHLEIQHVALESVSGYLSDRDNLPFNDRGVTMERHAIRTPPDLPHFREVREYLVPYRPIAANVGRLSRPTCRPRRRLRPEPVADLFLDRRLLRRVQQEPDEVFLPPALGVLDFVRLR